MKIHFEKKFPSITRIAKFAEIAPLKCVYKLDQKQKKLVGKSLQCLWENICNIYKIIVMFVGK